MLPVRLLVKFAKRRTVFNILQYHAQKKARWLSPPGLVISFNKRALVPSCDRGDVLIYSAACLWCFLHAA